MNNNSDHIKIAYITFDDGPNEYTSSILDILDSYNLKATFFNIGYNMKMHKNLVNEIFLKGHTLGLHSMSHDITELYKKKNNFIEEMNECNDILEEITGLRTRLIRPPYGSYPFMDKNMRNLVKDQGYILWDWNVDSSDKLNILNSAEEIIEIIKEETYVLENKNINPVILFHNQPITLNVLPQVLMYLKERGYKFKPLNEDVNPICLWDRKDRNYETYTVTEDDTLKLIAENNHIPLEELKEINGLTSEDIYIDKILYTKPKNTRSINKPSQLIINGDANSKNIAFTFDAGLEDNQTSIILDILKKHNIKATFFLTGVWVELFPELARRIAMEGHEIGNHSYKHPDMTKISHDEILESIIKGEEVIKKVTGVDPRPLFREPFGHWNENVFKAVGDAGYKYSIYWSIDTIDWQMPPVRVIVNRILRKVKGGDIVLMHIATNTTAEAVDIAITNLNAFGYKFVKVSQLLEKA